MFNDYNGLVTVEDLCEMLSIGKNSAYKLLASGDLNSFSLTAPEKFLSKVSSNI